jgi:hypothetical protein
VGGAKKLDSKLLEIKAVLPIFVEPKAVKLPKNKRPKRLRKIER